MQVLAKVFALGSVTALSGFVVAASAAGCSSTIGGTGTEGGVSPGGRDATAPINPPIKDASSGGLPDVANPDVGPGTCPSTAPIDHTTLPWKPPAANAGACTNADIDALVTFVNNNPNTQYSALKASVPAGACKTCLFAPDGLTWAPFVEKADGTFLRNNFGGCVATISGIESCGKAFSQYDDCLTAACEDCADQAAFDKCTSPAAKGACQAAAKDLTTECPTVDPITKCDDLATKYVFEAAARSMCVGP